MQVRTLLTIIIAITVLSGIATIFPVTISGWLLENSSNFPAFMSAWIEKVYAGLSETEKSAAFIFYGLDWLAFSHFLMAGLFFGAIRNPVRNKFIVEWALCGCMLALPVIWIAGVVRTVPVFHLLVDTVFAFAGIFVFLVIQKKITRIESLKEA